MEKYNIFNLNLLSENNILKISKNYKSALFAATMTKYSLLAKKLYYEIITYPIYTDNLITIGKIRNKYDCISITSLVYNREIFNAMTKSGIIIGNDCNSKLQIKNMELIKMFDFNFTPIKNGTDDYYLRCYQTSNDGEPGTSKVTKVWSTIYPFEHKINKKESDLSKIIKNKEALIQIFTKTTLNSQQVLYNEFDDTINFYETLNGEELNEGDTIPNDWIKLGSVDKNNLVYKGLTARAKYDRNTTILPAKTKDDIYCLNYYLKTCKINRTIDCKFNFETNIEKMVLKLDESNNIIDPNSYQDEKILTNLSEKEAFDCLIKRIEYNQSEISAIIKYLENFL